MDNQKKMTYKAHPLAAAAKVMLWAATFLCAAIFMIITGYVLIKGVPYLSADLFSAEPKGGVTVLPSIINTLKITAVALLASLVPGIGCAVYLTEYAKAHSKLVGLIRLTARTLSGIPSVIYGIFGSMFFVTALKWRLSILSGAFTLAIMVLPIIITSAEEALKSVEKSFREGSYGLGAGKVRTIFKIVLPAAVPGIISGVILAIGRIVGETAALIFTAGTLVKAAKLTESGATLSVQMYNLSGEGLHMNEASAAAVVLIVTVAILNSAAAFAAKGVKAKIWKIK